MKKLLCSLLMLTSLNSYSEVKTLWDSIKDTPKDYLVPCGIMMIGGAVIDPEDGLNYGALGCFASTAVVYTNKKDLEMFEMSMKNDIKDHMKLGLEKMRYDLQSDLQKHVMNEGMDNIANKFKLKVLEDVQMELNKDREELKKVLEKFAMNLEEYKTQVFNALVEKVGKIEENVDEEVHNIMTNTEFLSVLEKKIAMSMKGLAKEAIEEKKDEIIKECVRQSLLELHKTPVGKSKS